MPRTRTRLMAALAATAATLGVSGGSLVSPGTAQAITCSTASGQGRNFYPGPRSSNVCDTRFHRGPQHARGHDQLRAAGGRARATCTAPRSSPRTAAACCSPDGSMATGAT